MRPYDALHPKDRDWEHEKHLKASRKWCEPIRDGEFPRFAYPVHDRLFAAARRDFICLRRNVGGKVRRAFAHCRLPILWSYFMIYFIVALGINYYGIRNMLVVSNDQCWKYLYNFHGAVKLGVKQF
jgi:hypothetical protein